MSFDKEVDKLIGVEGGYSNNPADSGGETRWGITVAEARRNGYTGPMKSLPPDLAKRIYRVKYWDALKLDVINTITPEIASELFDTCVNMGQETAVLFLQKSLNALNRQGADYDDVLEDGQIGQRTIQALATFIQLRKLDGITVLSRMLNVLQGAKYIELSRQRQKDEAFVFGWFRTRIEIMARV